VEEKPRCESKLMSLAAVKADSKWLRDQRWNQVSAVAEWKKPMLTPRSCVKRELCSMAVALHAIRCEVVES
jgi:hypothetical protein